MPAQSSQPVATAPAKPVPSAGLVNDWLRDYSPALAPWDVGGEVRARYELKENAGDGSNVNTDFLKVLGPGQFNDNDYFLLRTKVHLGYTPINWLTAFVAGRDAYSDGDRRNPPKTMDRFDLEQAWLKLGDAKAFPLTAKVGRQELVYGDERQIGRADWNNLGSRVFDSAVLRFEKPVVWVDAFVGRPVMADPHAFNSVNSYDWLSGIYASTKSLISWQESQLYVIAHNASDKSGSPHPQWLNRACTPQDTYTVGFRFKSLPDALNGWDYSLEAAGQFGNVKVGGTRLEQAASAVMACGGYTWKKAWGSPRLGLGYDFFSGDADPRDVHNGTFEPLFPTNHRPLGLMDLIGAKNIHDPRVSFSFKPAKPALISLEWHSFWLATTADYFYSDSGAKRDGNGYGRNPGYDSYAGSEINLDFNWTFKPWAVLRAAHLFMASGRVVPVLQNARWVALRVAGRITEAIKEIACRAGGFGDASLGVAGDECAVVVHDVEFALHGIDDDVAGLGAVIQRIAVQPVALQRSAGQVEIDASGMVRDGLARADVVGLRRVNILHDVVEEPPFPQDFALHVHFNHGIHLAALSRGFLRVGPSGDGLVVGDGLVGDVECRGRVEFLVENPHPIVMRRVVLALFGVFPNRLAVPVHFLETRKAAGIILRRIHDIAVVEQVRIRPDRPRVDDATIKVEQEGPVAHTEERVAVQGFLLVAEEQFGRALEALVGERRTGEQRANDQYLFCSIHRVVPGVEAAALPPEVMV